ncbi:hypothetical protein JOF56_011617 [Kibdelosporangium banguiense]|uniref:Uncharacterized protein n=1 Tax=Kibdelosporangium banguiense TaxID=1365924 RepID=A0ABS4U3I9_9PSEU|nr:hypothetical protein [Kibdelosporangium banguiense]MBP2331232.1 hypothetical protein [Kibdelosporangium banguiense]
MAETIHLRGEGGYVHAFDLPLPDAIGDRVSRGEIVRVNKDGSPYVEAPAEKPLTPKEKLQADAAALGLATDGTVADLTARIDTKVAELREQAKELDIDGDKLSAVELQAAIDAALAK